MIDTDVVFDNRVAFADTLTALAADDKRIVAVCNDSVGSSNLKGFQESFPDRLINVGIAEQDMVGVGAGLAADGFIPFVCAAAPFLTGRSLEQVKADVAYSQHPVILCGMSPGMAYGELGPTHHSIEDLSWLRALPGLDIIVPADARQTEQAVAQVVREPRPTFIRVGRYKVPVVTDADAELRRGRFDILRDGSDVTIIATGTLTSRALEAAEKLSEEGLSVAVLNAAWMAPFDTDAVEAAARNSRVIITAEEATTTGGLGAAVATILAQQPNRTATLRIHGVTGSFAPVGDTSFLLEHFGLTAGDLARSARELMTDEH